MQKILCFALLLLTLSGCNSEKAEMYNIVEKFVESLQTEYESYGFSEKYVEYTKEGYYKITPMGRLIIVKFDSFVEDKVYDELKKDLANHFKRDRRVNKVYVNQAGTVVVDCRN